MLLRKEYTCPLELTHDMVKGKWKMDSEQCKVQMLANFLPIKKP
ncbi:MAG: hypothetical protein RR063_03015 [Anaerovoracaceae bacterium]